MTGNPTHIVICDSRSDVRSLLGLSNSPGAALQNVSCSPYLGLIGSCQGPLWHLSATDSSTLLGLLVGLPVIQPGFVSDPLRILCPLTTGSFVNYPVIRFEQYTRVLFKLLLKSKETHKVLPFLHGMRGKMQQLCLICARRYPNMSRTTGPQKPY